MSHFATSKFLKSVLGKIIYLPDLITPPPQQQVYFKITEAVNLTSRGIYPILKHL